MKIIGFIVALSLMASSAQATEAAQQEVGVVDQVVEQARDQLDTLVKALSEPWITFTVTDKDEDCLAKNIFYEAASEPEEGKVAVGMVTINRVRDGGFGKSICSVVNQRTVLTRYQKVQQEPRWYASTETVSRAVKVTVCQFSWVCEGNKRIRSNDERWAESQRVARALLAGDYDRWQDKYSTAMYFHATRVKPSWARQKVLVNRIGGHIFYAERRI